MRTAFWAEGGVNLLIFDAVTTKVSTAGDPTEWSF